jgi:hypothetical protein
MQPGNCMDMISVKWLLLLGSAAAWSTVFSMFNASAVRGWRNLGVVACYVLGLVMVFVLPWRVSVCTWAVAGVFSGVFYLGYEVFAFLRLTNRAAESRPRITTVLHGLFLWPIMLPEAIEYLLAELGVLKPPASAQGDEGG